MKKSRVKRSLAVLGTTLTLGLTTACGGTVDSAGEGDAADGFEYGASQSEVDEAIADLEPVTLTIQPYATSSTSPAAAAELAFMAAVEERSAGKIDFDVAWGQSIAPFSEVDDALNDGRLDIAYHAAIYDPTEYSRLDAFNRLGHYGSSEAVTGEAITQAMMSEAGWNDSELLEQYSANGLIPLNPLVSSGNYWAGCNSPSTTSEDWQGATVRIGGSVQVPIAESIGSSAVSMESAEVYEALQRGTVDCTFVQGFVAGNTGALEVAPYISVISDQRFTGAVTATHVVGSSFEQLPLPYQQIIFDAGAIDLFHGQIISMVDSSVQAVRDAHEAGGEVAEFDADVQEAIVDAQERVVDEMISDDIIDESLRQDLINAADKWATIADDLDYSDEGELSDIDEWFDPEAVDFRPLAERVFEDAAASHRPE